ncbi:M48 family metalloprotease [Mesorhizobium liriopis]
MPTWSRPLKRARLGATALALATLLSSCQMPGTGGEFSEQAFQPSAKPFTLDNVSKNDKLAEIARSQHPRILGTYGGEYSDPKLERMVAKVVGRLTFDPDNPNQTYRITILDSPNVNAFALPGGYLYVTRGLLALATDSAELAAVLAHEMGHVTANHGIERQRKEAEEALAGQVVSDVLGGGNTDANAALVRGKLRLAQFSRNQELEADAIGIRTIGRAGFDPYAAARFLQAMAAYGNLRSVSGASDSSLDFLASHPNAPQRIDLAMRHARQFGQPGIGDTDREAFLKGIDGLLFGDKPEEGFIRGTTFLHPKLGIGFSVPDGFVIDNSAAAVTATGPGDTAIRFDGVAIDQSVALEDYLRSGWVAGLDPASVQAGTIGGRPGAFAKARADGWQFDVAVVRDGGQVYRLLTAAPATSAALEPAARAVSGSFHFLSASEKAALKPLRVRVVTVGGGDTAGTLAAQMTGVDRKLELFQVINGLSAGESVRPGDKVKIITDR